MPIIAAQIFCNWTLFLRMTQAANATAITNNTTAVVSVLNVATLDELKSNQKKITENAIEISIATTTLIFVADFIVISF